MLLMMFYGGECGIEPFAPCPPFPHTGSVIVTVVPMPRSLST